MTTVWNVGRWTSGLAFIAFAVAALGCGSTPGQVKENFGRGVSLSAASSKRGR